MKHKLIATMLYSVSVIAFGIFIICINTPRIMSYNHVFSTQMNMCSVEDSIISKHLNGRYSFAKADNVTLFYIDNNDILTNMTITLVFPTPPIKKTLKKKVNRWINTVVNGHVIRCYYDTKRKVGYITPENIRAEIGVVFIGCVHITIGMTIIAYKVYKYCKMCNQRDTRKSLTEHIELI